MGAPKGNQYWRARTKHGRDKIFADSGILWDACCEYFDWVESHPLMEDKIFNNQGEIIHGENQKMRAMTTTGLCLFLNITFETWTQYKKKKDFTEVIKKAEAIIYSQKFEGASAGLLNPNIIARDLGLIDKAEQKNTGVIGEHDLSGYSKKE